MWVFLGLGKMCEICVCAFLKLRKCQKYTSEKVGQGIFAVIVCFYFELIGLIKGYKKS